MITICHCNTPLVSSFAWISNENYTVYQCNQHAKLYFQGNSFIVNNQSQQLIKYELIFPNKQAELIGNIEKGSTHIIYRLTYISEFPFLPLQTETYLQQAEQIIDKVLKLKSFL